MHTIAKLVIIADNIHAKTQQILFIYMLTYKLGEQITINEYCLKAEAALCVG